MRRLIGALALGATIAGGAVAVAKKPVAQERPEAFEALVKCRAIADEKARLQCYDQATVALEQAAERHDLVIVDKKQMRETRRTLFGLEIPKLKIFGGGDEGDEVRSIESTVVSAYTNQGGQWVVQLEDGSTWVQTDHNMIAITPRKGTKITVVKASLGSYMMRIGKEPGVRARRQM